jgi:hypothetical protein
VLVSPSDVPWDSLTDAHLEEMLHWLLHEMGAKDLIWRKGGAGAGAPDQGRDLEATFHIPGPTGDLDTQRWWIEAKGRSRTVEPAAVKDAVVSAVGRNDVDVLVVATNSQFSNPTRDWVTEWQRTHPRPRVQLWDRSSLERMLSNHPAVAARLFPRALTSQGQLEFVEGRFWNLLVLAEESTLQRLWDARAQLTISAPAMFALMAGERANGDLSVRPWVTTLGQDGLMEVLGIGLQNAFYLLKTSSDRGTAFEPIAGALGYLLGAALLHVSGDQLAKFIEECWRDRGVVGDLAPLHEQLVGPIVNDLANDMFEACASDCERVLRVGNERGSPPSSFWGNFVARPAEKAKGDDRVLLLVGQEKRCKMGFALTKDETCPLHDLDATKVDLGASLKTLERILRQRVEDARGAERA